MIKHIVMWKLKDYALGNKKEENAKIIKQKLESLNGKIPGMIKLEVGFDISKTAESFDIVLYSEFQSKKDLDNYQVHTLHKEAASFVGEVRQEKIMTDYTV